MKIETIKAVETSFGLVSAKRTHKQARNDAHQRAWYSLLKRRSTKWDDAKKLDSQASNAVLDAIIQEARQCRFDRRITLSALQWEQLEETQRNPWESEDPEALCSHAKLLLRVKAIRVARTMRKKAWLDYPRYRGAATTIAMTRQRVPTREEIKEEYLDDIFRDLA